MQASLVQIPEYTITRNHGLEQDCIVAQIELTQNGKILKHWLKTTKGGKMSSQNGKVFFTKALCDKIYIGYNASAYQGNFKVHLKTHGGEKS